MKKKTTIVMLTMLLAMSFVFSGCGEKDAHTDNDKPTVKNDMERAGEDIKDGAEKIGDDIKNGAEDMFDGDMFDGDKSGSEDKNTKNHTQRDKDIAENKKAN